MHYFYFSQKLKEFQDALDTDDTTYASLVNNAFLRNNLHNNGGLNNGSLNNGGQNCLFNLCDLGQTLQLDGEIDFQSLLDNSSSDLNKSSSMELLATTGWLSNLPPPPPEPVRSSIVVGALTIPRCKNHSESSHSVGSTHQHQNHLPVTMRRSSSVPCKPITDRGSTSSSDSGFSPGSPNQNTSSSLSHLLGTRN